MKEDVLKVLDQIKDEEDFFNKSKLLNYAVKQKGASIKEIGEYIGMKSSYICHIMRLERIPDLILDGYYSKLVSITHLFIIARIKDKEVMMAIYEEVLAKGLTSVQTEERVRKHLYKLTSEGDYIPPGEVDGLASQFNGRYKHSSLKVLQTRIHSKITIEIPGSLQQTTPYVREIIHQLLSSEQRAEKE